MNSILNIAAYLFVNITDTASLKPQVVQRLTDLNLRGTVLLAEEGINLFLAGSEHEVRAFLLWLRQDERFARIEVKESWSELQPFKRIKVKLKREIIRMDHPTVRPIEGRGASVDAKTLKRWLDTGHDDTGRAVVMLDTRNDFEVDAGTFENTVDWRIKKFTEFPQAFLRHKQELLEKTVVSFCTGGIRCEKASIFMQREGLNHTYQLEGGILKYFEEVGGAHYTGGCFVFDEREGLLPDLRSVKEVQAPPQST
jgi:UPF0176 protein